MCWPATGVLAGGRGVGRRECADALVAGVLAGDAECWPDVGGGWGGFGWRGRAGGVRWEVRRLAEAVPPPA